MKILRGYKTELDLNNEQKTACRKHAGAARFAYNFGLRRKIEAYRNKEKYPTAIDLYKEIVVLKKTELPWLYDSPRSAPQEALRNLDVAFKNFFRKVELKKQGKFKGKVGFPQFKSKKHGLGSFHLREDIHIFNDTIQLPRLGLLRLKERGYLSTDAKILSATVSEHAGCWFVSVQVEWEIPDPEIAAGEIIGVDLGIKTLATCSNGVVYENLRPLRKAQRRLQRAQRELSRRVKGGKNRIKSHQKVARLHFKIANIRKDTLHKITSGILARTKSSEERPAIVAIENLNVGGMLKNHKLAQAIADVGFYELKRQLQYKAVECGVQVFLADTFFPSSKMCSACGCINDGLTLADREWTCDCGAIHDRDLNAAINLRNLALKTIASSAKSHAYGQDVSPTSVGSSGRNRNRTASLAHARFA